MLSAAAERTVESPTEVFVVVNAVPSVRDLIALWRLVSCEVKLPTAEIWVEFACVSEAIFASGALRLLATRPLTIVATSMELEPRLTGFVAMKLSLKTPHCPGRQFVDGWRPCERQP